MLDADTKRKIDSARDILVGKVPDPKSQVEQITIALIYKFMDDMDKESVEWGGKPAFFTDEYEKYAWSRIFDPRLGGHDMLNLYSEAIIKMNQNPNIPQLFRDIFKNAYLPYRDPETLKLFLKQINDFSYDNSEQLGDAFEYLLSVLSSQGDAGQFRTPRHIIDFIVRVVNPQKHETVLDPACGTAGFLISSYRHILNNNMQNSPGDQLTPDEKKRLLTNFVGYDISSDMVRLSLVNMYLHGFSNPHMHEYDTLTSEDRWNDTYDVILANPPFMTPKGGIRPHKRFSIQAKRSEVLFVDYIAEHLNPNGRAGVIVPEGIIFQSQNAYKELRKMLVGNFLYAVVSLPAGVFNPYSGVKTSILLMDRNIAKRSDSILFVKVENDGYGLGARRKPNGKDDLPGALEDIANYKDCIFSGKKYENTKHAHAVKKSKIAENGDYGLSGDRYIDKYNINTGIYKYYKIGEICKLVGGGTPSKSKEEYWNNGTIRWISSKHINNEKGITHYELITEMAVKNSSTNIIPKHSTVLVTRVSVGKYALTDCDYAINQDLTGLIIKQPKIVDAYFLYLTMKHISLIIEKNAQGLGVKGITRKYLSNLKIPLPPLDVQQKIVAEIDGYQKIIDGARQVVENYKPQIKIDPTWPMVKIEEIINFLSGLTLSIPKSINENGVPIISMNSIDKDGIISESGIRKISLPHKKSINYLKKGDLLFNWRNGSTHLVGKTGYFEFDGEYVFASFLLGIRVKSEYLKSKFLWYLLNNYRKEGVYLSFMRRNVNGLFNRAELKILDIPLPSIAEQDKIIASLESEQKIIDANKKLIAMYEQKIKDKIAEVWGE